MRGKKLLAGFVLALFLTILPGAVVRADQVPVDQLSIAEGVFVDRIDISGLKEDAAEKVVENFIKEQGLKAVTVDVNGHDVVISLEKLGLKWVNRDVIHDATLLGRGGSVITRYKSYEQLRHEKKVYPLEIVYDNFAIDKFVENELTAFDYEPKDGSLKRSDGKFIIKESSTGEALNATETKKSLLEALTEPWKKDAIHVSATVDVVQPVHDSALLERVKDRIGHCVTIMSNMGNKNRVHNVTLGSKYANGTVLWPGEEASWNKLLGPRNEENGWMKAAEYVNGGSSDEYGGGICQTATTMYGALLDAEVTVTERYPHSRVIWYTDYAMDAAMSANYKDLKFRNDFEVPIYLECYVSGDKVIYNIYGEETRPSNRRVEYVSTLISEEDPGMKETPNPNMYVGQRRTAHKSYPKVVASLTKNVYVDGQLTESIKLHTDTYKALQGEVYVGTKPLPPPETKPPETKPPETKPADGGEGGEGGEGGN
ncbi:MAG: VanW family protein [Lachnospiraceae bacterium]|nr:VanW family protein [Lachnospiraceae bacterium]